MFVMAWILAIGACAVALAAGYLWGHDRGFARCDEEWQETWDKHQVPIDQGTWRDGAALDVMAPRTPVVKSAERLRPPRYDAAGDYISQHSLALLEETQELRILTDTDTFRALTADWDAGGWKCLDCVDEEHADCLGLCACPCTLVEATA